CPGLAAAARRLRRWRRARRVLRLPVERPVQQHRSIRFRRDPPARPLTLPAGGAAGRSWRWNKGGQSRFGGGAGGPVKLPNSSSPARLPRAPCRRRHPVMFQAYLSRRDPRLSVAIGLAVLAGGLMAALMLARNGLQHTAEDAPQRALRRQGWTGPRVVGRS